MQLPAQALQQSILLKALCDSLLGGERGASRRVGAPAALKLALLLRLYLLATCTSSPA